MIRIQEDREICFQDIDDVIKNNIIKEINHFSSSIVFRACMIESIDQFPS